MRMLEIEFDPSHKLVGLVLWLMSMMTLHHSRTTWLKSSISIFASVYTLEDTKHIPTAEPLFRAGDDQKLLDIHIDKELMHKKLDHLRSDKVQCRQHVTQRESWLN